MLKSHSSSISNPASMGRLVAHMILSDIHTERKDVTDTISVLNMLRLLEMYEYDLFDRGKPPGLLERDHATNLQLISQTSSPYTKLKLAVEAVHRELNGELTAPAFSQLYSRCLAAFSDESEITPDEDAREKATAFLQKLDEKLAP